MTCILRHHNECGCDTGTCKTEPRPIDSYVRLSNDSRAIYFRAAEFTLSAIIVFALGFAVAAQF